MQLAAVIAGVVLIGCASAWAAGPAVSVRDGQVTSVPVRGPAAARKASVALPRVWVSPADALTAAHRQTGLLFAVLPDRFDGAVGPFPLGQPVKVEALVARVAQATGTQVRWINDVAVFDPAGIEPVRPDAVTGPDATRADVSAWDARGDSGTVVPLTQLAGHPDGSVRLHALAALGRLEGDYLRNDWPGRVSILEVLADRIDRGALLAALEGGGPVGGRVWKLAVELLGRARERLLARYLWYHVWQYRDGTMELGMWALGRCGDPSGDWAMRTCLRDTRTNDPSHRYLAAMSQGRLDAADRLAADLGGRGGEQVEPRRAAAFGLGFCRADNRQAERLLLEALGDADAAVRFVACQSLARLGSKAGIERLVGLAGDAGAGADLRASALTALAAMGRPEAAAAVLAAAGDADPAVRATAAQLLSETGGPAAEPALLKLIDDAERPVRVAAAGSLGRLGTAGGIERAAGVLGASGGDADLRIAAAIGLGRGLSPEAAEPLGRVAGDVNEPPRLRMYAVLGLARLADRAGQKRMVELADRGSPKYLPLAVRHLELDSRQATAEFLIPYLTHADRDGACAAAGRLAELGFGLGVVELLDGSDVFDNHTRMMHMWGAVRAGGRAATLALVEATHSSRSSIRRTAAFSLVGRLYPEAIDALVRLTADPDPLVRYAAAEALSACPDPLAADALIALATRDDALPVALEAARALRGRDFRPLPRVRDVLDRLAGAARDPGGIADRPADPAAQPAHSFVLRARAEHIEEDLVSNLTYESSLCYDAHRNRIVMWGAHGRRYDSPQTAQTWFYQARTNRWTRLTDSRHWPNGVCGVRGTMYDDANRAVISPRSGGSGSHGWHNALRANLTHGSPWVLDVQTDQWYAARPTAYWGGGYMPASHDPVHGVTLWWRGGLTAYDVYANRWITFRPEGPQPVYPDDTGGQFDPKTGHFIAVAADSTWAFDPAANAWTDLRPDGPNPPPCPMVYDWANDVMLAFRVQDGFAAVWVYHIRQNRWEALPPTHPCPARGKIWDVAYDRTNNLTVIGAVHPAMGQTATLNCRETWTYRYRPAEPTGPLLLPPTDVRCATSADGGVTVNWMPAAGSAPAARFRIERGAAEQPWLVKWESAGQADAAAREFSDNPGRKTLTFYRVIAIGSDGAESRPSFPARTAPRIVRQISAVARAEGGVLLRWQAPPNGDVVAFRVYRAPVELGNAWTRRFSAERVADTLKHIADVPFSRDPKGSASPPPTAGDPPPVEWLDPDARALTPDPSARGREEPGGSGSELTWPATFAYVVRPVNAWGVEGGPSPVTLALADPPGPVRVVPWADGRRLVFWSPCDSGHVDGYVLMRMDDWHPQHVFRLHAGPLAAPGLWDDQEFPTGDRRRYYAAGVDELGTIGHPSSGEWSHGYP